MPTKLQFVVALLPFAMATAKAAVPVEQSIQTVNAIVSRYNGKTICTNGATLKDVPPVLSSYLEGHPEKGGELSDHDLYVALARGFPCPFDSRKVTVRPAGMAEIVGRWERRPESAKLSPKVYAHDLFSAKCQYFSFEESGSFLTISVSDNSSAPCEDATSASFNAMESLPHPISWRLDSQGVVSIVAGKQKDVWKTFAVTSHFDFQSSSFDVGDLIMYLVEHNSDSSQDIGTLYFQHLRRLKK